jgi:hypothetical protein
VSKTTASVLATSRLPDGTGHTTTYQCYDGQLWPWQTQGRT